MNTNVIGFYLVVINLVAFLMFGVDKSRARKHQWRVAERSLFLVALVGGSLGAICGMFFFRHKTKNWYFRLGLPLILLVQILLLAAVYYGRI